MLSCQYRPRSLRNARCWLSTSVCVSFTVQSLEVMAWFHNVRCGNTVCFSAKLQGKFNAALKITYTYSIITSVSCKNLTCFTCFSCCWSLYSFSESLVCTASKNSDQRDSFVLFINLFLLSMNRINKDSQSFECGVYGLRIPSLLFGEIWSHGLIEPPPQFTLVCSCVWNECDGNQQLLIWGYSSQPEQGGQSTG